MPEVYAISNRTLKRAGRALGRARDVDVALALAAEVEARAPLFAPPLTLVRTTLLRDQLRGRRKMIKRLDALDFEPLIELQPHVTMAARTTDLEDVVAAAIVDQSERVDRAIQHASGVYFKDRAHGARIAIKKLRYLVEFSDSCDAQCKALKLLRRAQEALGQIHDREVLRSRLKRLDWDSQSTRAMSGALGELLEAEIRTFYQQFIARRPEIVALLQALHVWAAARHRGRLRRRMLTVGMAAVPSAAIVVLAKRVAR